MRAGCNRLKISGALAAQLIDELPVLAAIAPYTSGGIRIRDAKELRVKESDRIALVAQNLRAMGAEVEEFEDGPGRARRTKSCMVQRLIPAAIIALRWLSAWQRLRAEGETLIQGAESASISFPEFFEFSTWLPRGKSAQQTQKKDPALGRVFLLLQFYDQRLVGG